MELTNTKLAFNNSLGMYGLVSTQNTFTGVKSAGLTSDQFVKSTIAFKGSQAKQSLSERVANIVDAIKSQCQGNIIVVSGPSGVGKDTVIDKVLEKNPKINQVVSYATRAPRPNEVDGVDYKFTTKEHFKKLLEENKLFQHLYFNDNYYGITYEELHNKRKGHDVIINVTADEALRIKKQYGNKAVLIFIDPPSIEELVERLKNRKTEKDPAEIERRIAAGIEQIKYADGFDYRVVNETGKLEVATQKALKCIDGRKNKLIALLDKISEVLRK